MKKLLSLVLAGMMVFSLAACGGGTIADSMVKQSPFEGMIFQLPKNIADTKDTSNPNYTYYYPEDDDFDDVNVIFQVSQVDLSAYAELFEAKDVLDETLNMTIDSYTKNLPGVQNETMLEKKDLTINSDAPIEAKSCTLNYFIDGDEYLVEAVWVPDVKNKKIYNFNMQCRADFDNIYANDWENMLNSIEFLAPETSN